MQPRLSLAALPSDGVPFIPVGLDATPLASDSPVRSRPHRPVRLPVVDGDDAGLTRLLPLTLRWFVTDDASPWHQIELSMAPPSADDTPTPSSFAVQGRHGSLRLPDLSLLTLLTAVQIPDDAPSPMRDELIALACLRLPAELLGPLGGPWTPGPMASSRRPGSRLRLTLTSRHGDRHAVLLQGTARTLLNWCADPGWQRHVTQALLASVGVVSLQGGLHLGSARLPIARLSHLRRGDAIWWTPPPGGNDDQIQLSMAGGLLHLSQSIDASYIFEGWGPAGVPPSNLPHAIPPLEPHIVDGLKVDLDFIAGSVSMSIAELSALMPGVVVPLQMQTPPQVRIVAHGTELGRGQLIDVEGRLAVEILEWGSPR